MSEKSALRLIPGKDALLEYAPQPYNAKTYVEYQGLIYKSKVDTSSSFVSTEWQLIGDLRELRVNNITDRNALTGNTPTSGTTGIIIPILDNTNVLVLNAAGDPQVGINEFARYNYNKTNSSWLLLQIGTGSTSGTSVGDYSTLSNKPPIISGITATAGAGLSGGGIFNGSVPPNRATFSFSHADTSSVANQLPTGRTYVQQLRFDTFGHVTGATTSTWTHPATSGQVPVSNTGTTYIQSLGLDANGHLTSIGSAVWTHPDTSTQASVNNTGATFIQGLFLDGDGHVTGIQSANVPGGGGGGVSFSVAGNSGSVYPMPDTGILRITGGTNIQTQTTLNGINLGVRVNVVPAGSTGQLQFNNGAAGLGASSAVVFSAGTGTFRADKMVLGLLPTTGGTTGFDFMMREQIGGAVRTINVDRILGTTQNAIQYRSGDRLQGNSSWIFDPSAVALTLGSRTGSTGTRSFVIGTNNTLSLTSGQGLIVGLNNTVTAQRSIIVNGDSNTVSNTGAYINIINGFFNTIPATAPASNPSFNLINGVQNTVSGSSNIVTGNNNIGYGVNGLMSGFANWMFPSVQNSVAFGNGNRVRGNSSLVGGYTVDSTKRSVASGLGSFTFQATNASLPAYPNGEGGAKANYSAVLGGLNNNIDISNTGSTVIGGQNIQVPAGAAYAYTTNVSNLAIWNSPSAGGTDDLLTWNSSSRKVGKVAQGVLAPSNHSNIIYVSMTGSDATGVVKNIYKPYQTVQAAVSAAIGITGKTTTNRVLVYVLPGTYQFAAGMSMSSFIDLHLCDGVVFNFTTNGATGIIYNNVDSNLYGKGTFTLNSVSANAGLLRYTNCTTPLIAEFSKVYHENTIGTVLYVNSSNVKIKCDMAFLSGGTTIAFADVFGTSDATIEFNEINKVGLSNSVVRVYNSAKLKISGNRITSESNVFSANDTALVEVDVKEINKNNASNTGTIIVNNSAKLKFFGKINDICASFAPIYYSTTTARVYLIGGSIIIAANANSASGNSAGGNIILYGDVSSNVAFDATKLTTRVGTLLVNSTYVDF